MNEADGNMTLWKDENDIITLGHTKVRGPEFLPQHFMIEKHTSPKIVDISGNLIALPVCVPVNESVVENKENSSGDFELDLMKAIASDPDRTQRGLATVLDVSPQKINRTLDKLKQDKFLEKNIGGKYSLTKKGRDLVKSTIEKENAHHDQITGLI